MKILINCSNLYVGGGVQVALSFLDELKHSNTIDEYHIYLSHVISKNIQLYTFTGNFHFYHIEKSPAPLTTRSSIVTLLGRLEAQIKPDIVFTIFGPSYWRPRTVHLMGFADGWTYNPKSSAYDQLTLLGAFRMRLQGVYKGYYVKRDADFCVVETEDARNKIVKTIGLNKKNVFVVGNTHSSIFCEDNFLIKKSPHYIQLPKKQTNEYRLIYIAHNHVNKNIQIIIDVLPFLDDYDLKFILTIDHAEFHKLFPKSTDKIINLGPVSQQSCPSIYDQSDALFAPTLLETFSASYPEAMKMNKPILTSNYSFAKDTCKDAALYFDPLDPKDISEKIKILINDRSLQAELISRGRVRLAEFETAKSRAKKYIALCKMIFSG